MAAPVPVIDIQAFPGQLSKLIEACEEWGCFRIVNFDRILPGSLMSEMKAVVRSLLELPEEIKRRNVDVIPGSGYMALSQINPLYEALGLYDMGNTEVVDSFCSKMDATTQQRDVVVKYAKAVSELMMYLGEKMGEGLGLKGISFEKWICQFRFNKYTFAPETVGSPGVQIHTDSSFLTILQDDEMIGGLEVKRRCGNFVAVDPCPGTLLVNLGDIAAVWSNGLFLNVEHRVMCKEAGLRFSIASFLLGPKDTMVETPPELIDLVHPPLYNPFMYHDYRKLRMSNKFQRGEALGHLLVESRKVMPRVV